jgi:hypothetical protein
MELPVFPWRIWCATALLALVFFGFTLTTAVPVWFDESFIVEYGRVTLAGQPAGQPPVFGFHQRSDSQRPVYASSLLGVVLQELAFRATAPSNLGPRVASLIGQIAAFGCFTYYLLLRGLNRRYSVLLGLAFLIDPLCDISWRGGRVDAWTFACLFASLSAIRIATGRPHPDRVASRAIFLGGVAAAAGLLFWPSFLIFSPLIVAELWALVRQQRAFLTPMGLFAAGGTLAAAAMIAPFYREFVYGLADANLLTVMQSKMSRSDGLHEQFRFLLLSFVQTPIVVAAGLCTLMWRRNRLLLVGFLIALVFIFGTKVYRLRVLYLLPYFYLAVASFFQDGEQPVTILWQRARAWTVGLMLFAGAGFTVAGTTLSGLSNRSGKDPLALIEPARSAVGSGSLGVYTDEPDLYFVGRALGWRQFYCFDGCWGPGLTTQTFQAVLADMDVAIFRDEPDALQRGVIEKLGFRFSSVILPDGGHQNSLFGLGYGPRSYGPYFIYRRP